MAAAAPERTSPTLATIIATLGPATDAPGMVGRLIEAGVGALRLNFSHGTLEEHAARVSRVRAEAERLGRPVAIIGDLPGPKIRLGRFEGEGVEVRTGEDVLIGGAGGGGAGAGGIAWLPCEYGPLAAEVKPGERVLINDGAVRMLAVERQAGDAADVLRCRVTVGGVVSSRKGLNLPDSDISASALTERDWSLVGWSVERGLDFLAMSFVRRAEEVRALRRRLQGLCPVDRSNDPEGRGSMIPVIAKIEKPQAVEEIDGILEAADAIMIARGDLGVEMDLAEVPVVQKRLIAAAGEWGKPAIVATQMLESMIDLATPTRAEASDVANAVLDGADAVMLSGETAVGRHPALVVETMRRIVVAAEARLAEVTTGPSPPQRLVRTRYRTAALAHGAWHTARDLGARLVACWSQRGGTARYLSQTDLRLPIVAYSSDRRETRRMALLRAVTPIHCEVPAGGLPLSQWMARVERDLLERRLAAPGDAVVLLAGQPLGEAGATTSMAVHYVGNPMTGFARF
jgi:pyruvate kinase